ncbi:ribonuclease P protein component [Microbacterium amylolyticum]|nr:ribonuclease P protein component [Microbacterium amylolyticum]
MRCASTSGVTHVILTKEARPARFGFIVSKAVGNAVVRNTVRRRLKAICHEASPSVREGADIVIRALPASATTSFADLRRDVLRCLERQAPA